MSGQCLQSSSPTLYGQFVFKSQHTRNSEPTPPSSCCQRMAHHQKCQSTLAQQFHKHTKNDEEKKTCCTASATVHCAPKRKQRKENIIKRSIVSYKFDRLLRNIAIVDTRRTRPKEAVLAPTHAHTHPQNVVHMDTTYLLYRTYTVL